MLRWMPPESQLGQINTEVTRPLRSEDTHGGEPSEESNFAAWPPGRPAKKLVLEMLGFKWDKYNALHAPHIEWKTQLGQNVTCLYCKQLITLKNIGGLAKIRNTIQFCCKRIGCELELSFQFRYDEDDND